MQTEARSTQDNTPLSQRFNGMVLHLAVQSQEERKSTKVDAFRNECATIVQRYGGISSRISYDAMICAFAQNSTQSAELVACQCAHEIRQKLVKMRLEGSDLIMKASINGGDIFIGNKTEYGEDEILGTAVNISFQVLDSTQPMQVTLTKRVCEKVAKQFASVSRRPVLLGTKNALLFYLHTPQP